MGRAEQESNGKSIAKEQWQEQSKRAMGRAEQESNGKSIAREQWEENSKRAMARAEQESNGKSRAREQWEEQSKRAMGRAEQESNGSPVSVSSLPGPRPSFAALRWSRAVSASCRGRGCRCSGPK